MIHLKEGMIRKRSLAWVMDLMVERRYYVHRRLLRAYLEMNHPKKDIQQLQHEMDTARADVKKVCNGEVAQQSKNQSLDAVLTGAGMLIVLGLAMGFASQLNKQQVTILTSGSIGVASGLVLGYAVGRRKNG